MADVPEYTYPPYCSKHLTTMIIPNLVMVDYCVQIFWSRPLLNVFWIECDNDDSGVNGAFLGDASSNIAFLDNTDLFDGGNNNGVDGADNFSHNCTNLIDGGNGRSKLAVILLLLF